MQIRTIFHNANFLKKSTPNADERAALKAGRRLVCVLLMLVACAGAVCGAEYRWKNDADSGDWTTASNWEVSTDGGSLWGEASSAPGDGDNVTFRGAANANIVVTLPSNFTPWLGNLIINSSNAGPYTLTMKCESGTTPTLNSTSKLCIAGCDGGSVNLVLDGVNLNSTGELRINDNLEENRYDGTITISNNGTGSITASKLLIFGDAAVSPNAFCVNFTNVPVAVSDTIEINWDEKSGIVEVATDATLGGNGRINIGKANWAYGSYNRTTTIFSGSGTISTSNFNFPDGTSHHLKLDGNITLDTGSMDVAGSGGVTIEGTGNLSITYPVNQDDNLHLDPDVNVSKTDGTYTYSVTVGSFDGFGASGSELEITVTGTTTDASFSQKTLAYEFSGSKFSLDGVSGDTITIPANSTGNTSSKTFKVTCTSELSENDGFELKIRVSNGGAVIKTVSWTLKTPKWKGLSTEWNSVSNWDGIYYMKALESLEADVQSTFGGSAVSSFPVISTNAKAKKLTIGDGAIVTQTGGTFTVENIALSGSGKFISTGGEVVFSKSGTWSDSSGTSNFTDVTIPSGVTLTLGSDLTVAKLTVASGGTLVCNEHTLTITDSSAIEGTVTAAKFTATGMGGKTLTINGTLSVGTAGSTEEDTLKLEGSSIGSKLNISGTGTIKLNATQPGGKWLNLSSDAGPVVKDLSDGTTVKFWTTYSTKTGTTAPSGWTVFAGDSIYEWTGATDTAWTTVTNWNTNAVPEAESIVKINTVGTGRYPVTPATETTVATLSVGSGASITLGAALTVSGVLTNEGTVDTNGKALSFASYSDPSTGNTGTIKVGASNTVSSTAAATVGKIIFSGTRTGFTETTFANIVFTNIEVAANSSLSLGDTLSVSGKLTNNGTISTDGKSITTGTFAGSGGYTVSGEVTLSSGVSGTPGTVASVTTTDTTTFTQTGSYTLTSFTVDNGNTLTLGSSLSLSGTLTNTGTIDTNGYNLSFNTLADTGTIKVGTANTLSAGTATQTVNNLLFTAGRTDAFSGFTNINFKNIELTTGTLTLGSNLSLSGTLTNNGTITTDGKSITAVTFTGSGIIEMKGAVTLTGGGTVVTLKVTNTASLTTSGSATYSAVTVNAGTLTLKSNLTVGTLTNNGTINIDNKSFQCTTYAGNSSDSVLANGGTFTAQSGTVHYAKLNSNTINSKIIRSGSGTLVFDTVEVTADGSKLTVTNNDTGTLTFGTTTFSADATLAASVSGSASVPAFTTVTVNSGKTLTLGSDLTVGTLTNKGTVNAAVSPYYNLTVSTKLENQGTVRIDSGKMLSFEEYSNSASVKNDRLTVTDGTVVSTGSGGTIWNATLNGTVTVEKSGAGALSINIVTVSAAGSALMVVNSNSSGTLTFGTLAVDGSTTVSGTANVTGNLTATADLTVAGSVNVDGTLSATNCNVTVNNGKTLAAGKFVQTASSSGKSLSVAGTLTVGGSGTNSAQDTLRLSGTASYPLTVSGGGVIRLNKSQVGGSYLNVSGPAISKINSTDDDVIYTTTYSSGTSVSGWNICDGELVYVWTGNAGTTSWTTGKNWSVYLAPVNTDDNVKIATATYYPETSQNLSLKSLTVETGASVTVVNNTLGFKTYSGSGTVILKSDGNLNVISGGSGGTVENLKYAESHGYTAINSLAVKNVTVDPGVELTLNSNLSLASGGVLTNYGIIDIGSNSLFCASYYTPPASTEGIGTIKLGLGTFIPGSGGTLNNIEFTATRDFENISNLTITNGTVDSSVALTVTAGGLSFAGSLDNNGTVNIGAGALQFAQYQHTANTLTDALTIAGGSITATGVGTGMISVSSLTMNGNATVTNNGSGALKFASATVNANVLLTSGGSGSAPVFSALKITGGNTLTLASNMSAGNVTIEDGATLDADSRGVTPAADSADPSNPVHGCTTFGGGYVLTVSGNFINENTGHSIATPYPGFVAQHGRVEITGNGTHEIRGNNKFHDFVCVSPEATLIFDAKKTTNVDHQIWLEGSGSNLITLTTDNAAEGEKWTLDVVWDVAAGTAEHRKPHIEYAAPHKSISYSAKLKGCLVGCIDDAPNLRDSTNVNWFDDMPSIFMSLASVGGKQLAVMFSTEVDAVAGRDLRTAVALKTDTGSNLIDASVPVSMYSGSTDKSKTVVVYGLTRALTWDDLFGSASDRLHVEIVQSGAVLVRNSNIKYQMGVKHCASDFAINGVRMLFGYDNYIDPSTTLTAEKGTNSVRTWDQSDPISNRLHSDSDLLFQAQFDESAPSGLKLEMAAMNASQLNASVIGNNLMDYYGLTTRLWLPSFYQPVSTVAQSVPSGQVISQDSSSSGRLRNFTLHYSASSTYPLFQMKDGEEIQFMFKVKNADDSDFQIIHDYAYDAAGQYVPVTDSLYAIRLVDDADITTFDLWSVMLQATTLQRGNVTILNNVINSDQKEQTFVTIQMQKAGSLTVQVLTLDGAVVTTLQRGRKQAGTYGYSWNGTNGKGKPVARGMYFVRVIGPDIDETRKVMVVRD